MTMTTTRRNIIAGAAALPLLPTLAASVTLPLLPVSAMGQGEDPAVKAYEEWRAAFATYLRSFDLPDHHDDHPVFLAAEEAEDEAADALANTVPTTAAGLAAQIAFAHYAFGEVYGGGDWFNLADYHFDNWADDRDGRLIRSMTAGAQRLAGVAS